jgi:hypothetical protein
VDSDFNVDFGADFGGEEEVIAWLVGNTAGDVLALQRTNRDLAASLNRRAIARSIYLGDRKFSIPKVELLARMGDHTLNLSEDFALSLGNGEVLTLGSDDVLGVGSVSGDERDAFVFMYESLDGGRTWRGAFPRSMGRNGDFTRRMVWHSRGQAQQYTLRFDITDPADLTVYAEGFVTAA